MSAAREQDAARDVGSLASLKAEGREIYERDCASCHGAEGNGDGAGPSLDGNTKLSSKDHVIKRILLGAPENGMDPFGASLSDRQVAAAATFVRNAWNNTYGVVTESDVQTARSTAITP